MRLIDRFRKLTLWTRLGAILGVLGAVASIISLIVYLLPSSETYITISYINDLPLKDCTADGSCSVFSEGNTVGGIVSKNDFQIYIISYDMSVDQYIVQGRAADGLHYLQTRFPSAGNEDRWEGEFSLGEDENIGKKFVIYAILTSKPLEKDSKLKNFPSYIARSKGIRVTLMQKGSYISTQRLARISEIAPLLRIQSSRLYADIYIGRKNFKQSKTTARTVIANLFYDGFEYKIVRAEIDWGEGMGWEVVDLHKQGEYYQVSHTFHYIGRKAVKYRLTDERGDWIEAIDYIEIISQT